MCNLTESVTDKTEVKGWKVVAVDGGGNYYSPAMGCKYIDGEVPISTDQSRLTSYFTTCLLFYCYQSNMVGRTAIFLKKEDALAVAENCLCSSWVKMDHNIGIVESKVTDDLLKEK